MCEEGPCKIPYGERHGDKQVQLTDCKGQPHRVQLHIAQPLGELREKGDRVIFCLKKANYMPRQAK